MKIAVFPNLTRKNAYAVTMNLVAILKQLDLKFCFPDDLSALLPDDLTFAPESEIFKTVDVIIVVGGDGSMMRTAKSCIGYKIPVLGVNAGNLAYLMNLDASELNLLSALKTGNFAIEKRMTADVKVTTPDKKVIYSDLCINDIIVARGKNINPTRLRVFCDGKIVGEYNADGIVVSTPTGSTAYNLSAKGPIVDPALETIIVTPVSPHSLTARPIIFSSASVIEIENPADNERETVFSCDGEDSIAVPCGSIITVKKAAAKTRFIRIKDDSFIETLYKKLSEI